ncbi:TolC family protein [Acidithiobacillus sp.]|uniref:TolC family protein n=1 Tax=Acidithiobacillus sp. TaxID=1872118 RepID=UPI0026326F8A|nr:TolC family protein [Acidithiobacillus sp.]MDD2750020.1 TolC family protein [Acidithiobacillus sp.]MDD5279251.1 TolC family protein [Acidithiobacillus sp.]
MLFHFTPDNRRSAARNWLLALSLGCISIGAHAAPLTLNQAINSALHNQATVQASRHQLKAQQDLSRSAEARLLPALSLNAATIWTQSRAGQPVFVGANGAREMLGQIRLNVPIYAPQTRALSKLDKDQVTIERFHLQQTRLAVAAQVSMTYYRLALSNNMIAIWRRALVAATQVFQATRDGYAAGTRSRLALKQAQLNLLRIQSKLKQTLAQSVAIRQVLALQTGLGGHLPPLAKVSGPLKPLPDLSKFQSRAMQAQPLLRAADAQIQAAHAQLQFHQNARLPVFSANAAYGVDTATIPHSAQLGWQAGLSLQMPIFGFGRNRDQIAAAREQVAALQSAKSALQMQIRSRLEQDAGAARAASIALKNAGEIEYSAQAVYTMTRKGYLAGAESALALQQAEDAWVQAQLQATNAMIRARLTRTQLILDSGFLPGQGAFS